MSINTINFGDLGRTYRITPIQQPQRSAAFNGAYLSRIPLSNTSLEYLSRIPLSPPLIIQFDCWDAQGALTIPNDEVPFLVCHLTLHTESGEDATMVRSPDQQVVSMLYGTLVASPTEMRDRDGAQGLYFAFPDVSVRYVGRFSLRASLMRITGGPPLDTCVTEPFDIVENAQYSAPAITDLTRHFDEQGIIRFGLPRSEW